MSSFGSSAAPNILVTGTPGTGKTTLCSELAERLGLRHLQVGDIVRQESAHEGWDEEHESYILDEDKLVDAMEPMLEPGVPAARSSTTTAAISSPSAGSTSCSCCAPTTPSSTTG